MANNIQSNPVYYSLSSLSSGQNLSTRTVVLHRRSDHAGFGVYIGEDVPAGLYIVTVERNSPASDASIQPGDRVLAVNGQLVSTMKNNPKEMLIKAATNAQSLTLTIQSTDVFRSLDIPLANGSRANQEQPTFNQYPAGQTFTTSNMDLESYVRSLFANENVEILPSSKQNEFILNTKSYPGYWETPNSLPNQPQEVRERKKKHRSHRHHHRNHRPKSGLLQTKETQTSIDRESQETLLQQPQQSPPRKHFSKPNMDTPQLAPHIPQQISSDNTPPAPHSNQTPTANQQLDSKSARSSSSSDDLTPGTTPEKLSTNSRNNSGPMSHMADVVTAAIHAKHHTDQSNHHAAPSSRDSNPLASHPATKGRSHEPAVTANQYNLPSQLQRIPPVERNSREPTTTNNPTAASSQLQRIPPVESNSREPTTTNNPTAASSQLQRIPPAKSNSREPATTNNPTAASSQLQRIPPTKSNSREPATTNNPTAASSQLQRIPPTESNSREPATATDRTAVASQNPHEPPPYTELPTNPSSSRPTDNRSANAEEIYNVPAAEANQRASVPMRPDGTRELSLTRMENFQGFGFHLQYNKSYYLVQRIEANSPAEQAGLHANDVILSINQEKTDDMPHVNFVQIVNSNSTVIFVVQALDEYLRAHPPRARKEPSATAVAAAATISSADEPDKQKSGVSKVLNKLTNR